MKWHFDSNRSVYNQSCPQHGIASKGSLGITSWCNILGYLVGLDFYFIYLNIYQLHVPYQRILWRDGGARQSFTGRIHAECHIFLRPGPFTHSRLLLACRFCKCKGLIIYSHIHVLEPTCCVRAMSEIYSKTKSSQYHYDTAIVFF